MMQWMLMATMARFAFCKDRNTWHTKSNDNMKQRQNVHDEFDKWWRICYRSSVPTRKMNRKKSRLFRSCCQFDLFLLLWLSSFCCFPFSLCSILCLAWFSFMLFDDACARFSFEHSIEFVSSFLNAVWTSCFICNKCTDSKWLMNEHHYAKVYWLGCNRFLDF